MPVLAEQLGATDVIKGLLVSSNLVALTIGNLLNTVSIKKIRPIYLLSGALTLFTGGIIFMASLKTLPPLYAATALMGFANGVSYPTLMGLSIRHVDQPRRTSAMGIHQSVYAFGMFSGPWLGGINADYIGIQPMFMVVAGFVYIGSIALLIVYQRFHRKIEAGIRE